jgi:hypothetical protein
MSAALHDRHGIEHRACHASLGKPQRLDGMEDPHDGIVSCCGDARR